MYHILKNERKCGIRSAYLELMYATCIHKFKKTLISKALQHPVEMTIYSHSSISRRAWINGDFRKLHSDSSTFIVSNCWSQICMITFPKNVKLQFKKFLQQNDKKYRRFRFFAVQNVLKPTFSNTYGGFELECSV